MPIYDFECTKCGNVDEVTLKMSERDSKISCSKCHSDTERKLGNYGGFQLKGSCWSADGYSRTYGDTLKFQGKKLQED